MPKPIKSTRPEKAGFLRSYWAALTWAAFILLLISLPGEDLPDFDIWAIDIEDKIGHLGVFGVLAFLMTFGAKKRGISLSRKEFLFIFLISTFYGGLTEVLQGLLFTSRFASISDFLADLLGALLGTVFGFMFFKQGR